MIFRTQFVENTSSLISDYKRNAVARYGQKRTITTENERTATDLKLITTHDLNDQIKSTKITNKN